MGAHEETVLCFKGFDSELKCRGHQFVVGETYVHNGAVMACESGWHACENPLDVWAYYGLCESRFALVELSGELSRQEGDSKVAAARIHVKAELSLPDFINRAVTWLIDRAKSDDKVQSASGYSSQLAASGNYSRLAASGDYSRLAASGHSSRLAASGHSSRLAASGENSVIASSAMSAIAKGAEGTWISLAEFDDDGKCVGFATGCVGKDGLKPDTWHRASGGKLIEGKPHE